MRPDNDGQMAALLTQMHARIKDDPLAIEFGRLWWSRIPAQDLQRRNPGTDAELTERTWQTFRQRDRDRTLIQVDNPPNRSVSDVGEPTCVLIHAPNMPFVTDSVQIALSHDGQLIHHISNVVLAVERDSEGRVTALSSDRNASNRECLIHAEVDRLPEAELAALEQRLRETLADVRACVEDFEPMRARLGELIDNVRSSPATPDTTERDEAVAFLEWMSRNNFTFLGARSFSYEDGVIRQIEGSSLGVLRLRNAATPRELESQDEVTRAFLLRPEIISFSQSGTRSRVHRHAYPAWIGVRQFDADGNVTGECGLLGLFTSRVYHEQPDNVPIVRQKVAQVRERSNLDPAGFDGKVLNQVLATFPRESLFQTDVESLLETVLAITYIHERRRTRLFVRPDPYGLFVHCLVYLPRDLYNTYSRRSVINILMAAYGANDAEFEPFFSESILVRLQVTLRIPPGSRPEPDADALFREILDATRDWQADLHHALSQRLRETESRRLRRRYAGGFPPGYRDRYSIDAALADIATIESLTDAPSIATRFHRDVRAGDPIESETRVCLKLFHAGTPLPLADVIQTLEHLGLRVLAEHPHVIERVDAAPVNIYDFALSAPFEIDIDCSAQRFDEAFERIWKGEADDDRFNRLILGAGLDWRRVGVLRAYAGYMQQIRFGFSDRFIADTLFRYSDIAALLVDYFETRFDPELDARDAETRLEELRSQLTARFDEVELLNEDRVLRRYLELFDATLRTNHWRTDADGAVRPFLSLKFAPGRISSLPRPVPKFEIYVFSPQVEGVHLRGGLIARGGLRWSDRAEDYRTEVLGLVKAQNVKNAVIVPNGAKGGFIVRRPEADNDAFRQQGVACYRHFISGLLDVTDNVVGGEVVPPPNVRRHDGDDPYLVVAADKGTATFSDIANEVAESYGHWLGDAFASGGSYGYDHKAMGITARGAWVSVQRHFMEQGVDVQSDPITVIGIGDMSGDVFGNGMLLSRSIRLVAAFNHRHIFLDPDPDPERSFAERERLFGLQRSAWTDYDPRLLSEGGAIVERSAKFVAINPQLRERFGLDPDVTRLAPDELINALLKAPVDLIWNGGIGTYVKGSQESHADVGDRANDGLRVNGNELRARAFGEGGNLGLTQAGRIEFAQAGGAVNTDFIDNAAGVDCSDHEVNIKIVLNQLVQEDTLSLSDRNALLESMTEDVAELVLTNNFRQAQMLSLAQRQCVDRPAEFARFIDLQEEIQQLDRKLEGLPSAEALNERNAHGGALSRPELAVLMAYAKLQIKQALSGCEMASDPALSWLALKPFPRTMVDRYESRLRSHRLLPELVATELANDMVHHAGIIYVTHLSEFVGASVDEIAAAWLIAAECFELRERFREIEAQSQLDANVRQELLLDVMRLGRRATRWLLRHERTRLRDPETAPRLHTTLSALRSTNNVPAGNLGRERRARELERLQSVGLDARLADRFASAGEMATALTLVRVSQHHRLDPAALGDAYAEMGEALRLDWLIGQMITLDARSHWQTMERDALIDDMLSEQGELAARALAAGVSANDWLAERTDFKAAWDRAMSAAQSARESSFAIYPVTCRKLVDAVRNLPR